MRTSPAGIEFIKREEGLRLRAYRCSANVWTIGYGHTGGVREGDVIASDLAERLLVQDLRMTESAICDLVKAHLTQNEFDALVSLVFNIGIGNFAGSTMRVLLNNGRKDAVGEEFRKWNKIRKSGKLVVSDGLTARRKREEEMFDALRQLTA